MNKIPKTLPELEHLLGRRATPTEALGLCYSLLELNSPEQHSLFCRAYLNDMFTNQPFKKLLFCNRSLTDFFNKYYPNDPQGRYKFIAEFGMELRLMNKTIEEWLDRLGLHRRQERLRAYTSGYSNRFYDRLQFAVQPTLSEPDWARERFDIYVSLLKRRRHLLFTHKQTEVFKQVAEELKNLTDIELELPFPHCVSPLAEEWQDLEVELNGMNHKLSLKFATRRSDHIDWGVTLGNCLANHFFKRPLLGVFSYDQNTIIGAFELLDFDVVAQSEAKKRDAKAQALLDQLQRPILDFVAETLSKEMK